MQILQPLPKVIEAPAVGGPFCGSVLTGYRATLLARAVEGGSWHCYALATDDGGFLWQYMGVHHTASRREA